MHCMLESERVTYGMPMQYIDLHNKSIDVFGLYQRDVICDENVDCYI